MPDMEKSPETESAPELLKTSGPPCAVIPVVTPDQDQRDGRVPSSDDPSLYNIPDQIIMSGREREGGMCRTFSDADENIPVTAEWIIRKCRVPQRMTPILFNNPLVSP